MADVRWRRLDLPDGLVVEHVSDSSPGRVVVSGSLDEVAYAAHLTGDGDLSDITIPPEAAVHGSARVVRSCHLGLMGVCGAVGWWGHDVDTYNGVDTGLRAYTVPADEQGAEADWAWVTAGDDQLLATVAYPTDGGHEVRVLDLFTRELVPVERRLVTTAPLDALHVAAFAGRVTVAGPIGVDVAPTVWWSTCAVLDPAEFRPDPVPWLDDAFEGPAARLTDGLDWDVMSFYAGLDPQGRVALWDGTGQLRESTTLRADPADPVVLLAELEGWSADDDWMAEPDGLAAFVVATSSGNVLSFRGSTYDVPDGRLGGAVLNRGFDRPRCFALLDDVLHVGELEY